MSTFQEQGWVTVKQWADANNAEVKDVEYVIKELKRDCPVCASSTHVFPKLCHCTSDR